MKQIHLAFLLIITALLYNCIGEDIREDAVPEEIRFLNPIESIAVSETYQFNVSYFNNVGEAEVATIIWSSQNSSVATIDTNGLVTAISEGTTTIKAEVVLNNDTSIENSIPLTITKDIVTPNVGTKSGTISTTSSYLLEGDFTLSEIEGSNNLELSINSNYKASTSLPGLYLYLSNNPNSISGAYEVEAVSVFNGAHSYIINNTGLNDYAYLLYWCKPFGVKVGDGKIND